MKYLCIPNRDIITNNYVNYDDRKTSKFNRYRKLYSHKMSPEIDDNIHSYFIKRHESCGDRTDC